MKISKVYLYLSIASLFLTLVAGIGLFLSIILLFLINSEKKGLLIKYGQNSIQEGLHDLKLAKKISIVNIILNLILIIIAIFLVLILGYFYIIYPQNFSR